MDPNGSTGPSAPKRALPQPYRLVLLVLAWILLAAGIVGLVLPFVPGTLFLILAAACFTRSSPRFEAWLLEHPRYGPPIRGWRATGAIPRRGKVFACSGLALSWIIILASDAPAFARVLTLVLFVTVGLYISTRPEA